MDFIGRDTELAQLSGLFTCEAQRNALIYGRRRIGKSELIKRALELNEGAANIYFECRQTSESDNVASLSALAAQALGFPPLAIGSVRELLDFLFEQGRHTDIVLVLDEYSYLREAVKGLDSIIQTTIDANRERSRLKIVLCGSYVAVMKSLVESSNPLYGRIDLAIELGPMDYYDAARFYPAFSPDDKVRLFSVFGGIPYYNRLVDQKASVRDNIIELVTAPGSRLENEVPGYLGSEISRISNANEVFGALAQGYSRWRDLLDQSHVSSGPAMADVLAKLAEMGLVQRRAPINDAENKRKAGYFITDPLALFFYRYVFRCSSQRLLLAPEVFYERFVQDDFEERHVPHMFEEVCRQHLVRQNLAGKIEPAFDAIGRYWYDDPERHASGEFDVVTHDPRGYVFYEAKFRKAPLSRKLIDEEIAQVKRTGLDCHAFGFFSRSGFEATPAADERFIELAQMFD